MITDQDSVTRRTCADITLTTLVRLAVEDNFNRIPLTREGGYISTEFSEDGTDDTTHMSICGYVDGTGMMMQQLTVIYLDTREKVRRFLSSPEGQGFDAPYGDGQDLFEFTTYAGNPEVTTRIAAILKNHFALKETSHLVADTTSEVNYFRKVPADSTSKQVKS